jgi:hypothetical protein
MKKLILTLLLTSLATYSQSVNVDLTVSNIIPVDFNNHKTEAKALTIPSGKIWIIQGYSNYTFNAKPNLFSVSKIFNDNNSNGSIFLTGGTKVWTNIGVDYPNLFNIIEFNAPSTQTGTLALNEIKEINNKIELFPNPTNSKIALNSEKNYTIEIYDMQGQIVMKDKGNKVDLSNLSNAVYILKAYDNYEKTTTSYKVVKK